MSSAQAAKDSPRNASAAGMPTPTGGSGASSMANASIVTASIAAPAAVAKPAKPGLADDAAPGDPSRPLLASVDAGKVVVVLFWNKSASDDRATRRALRAIDLHARGIVDQIVAEQPDAADEPEAFCQRMGAVLVHELAALLASGPGTPADRARRYE